jgi:mono/diheme cytochrome c family protein
MRPALIPPSPLRGFGATGRRGWSWCLVASVAALLFATASGQAQQKPGAPATGVSVERGRYLVNITGCHDCHSPKSQGMTPDPARLLSGRPPTTKMPSKPDGEIHTSLDLTAWFGPWGPSVASNLTPDTATGLPARGYNEKTFVQTMRSGKKPNGTAVMPPMPIEVYQNLTDDDLRSIWAYLVTLKPIRNAVLAGTEPAKK